MNELLQGRDPRKVAMTASMAASFLMLAGKVLAYVITGSSAILSDAAESVVHMGATGIASLSLWYSTHPADKQYLYGYGKVTYFSAGIEGALISLASLSILYVAIQDLIVGPELRELGIGLVITGALGLINLALGLYLVSTGRKHDSLVLVANGKHVLTDMWTSMGVVVGVGVVWATDVVWLDPLVAIAVGLNILVTAVSLVRQGFEGLMEKADPNHSRSIVDCLERAQTEGSISSFHQLRHRKVNDQLFIEVHLLLPGDHTLMEAHRKVTTVEQRIRKALPGEHVHVTSHIEPVEHDKDHPAGHDGPADALTSTDEHQANNS